MGLTVSISACLIFALLAAGGSKAPADIQPQPSETVSKSNNSQEPAGKKAAEKTTTPLYITESNNQLNGSSLKLTAKESKNPIAEESKTPENQLPNGRYRNLVFDEDQIGSTKDITFKTRADTKLIKNSDTDYDLVDDLSSLVDLKLNMYYPLNDQISKRPLLIFVYGGGWIEGDRYQREPDAIYFARMGYVTMTIEYTMLPEGNTMNPVPSEDSSVYVKLLYESASDLYSAYQYATTNKSTYGIDSSRIGIGGWSAGGMLSQTLTHAEALPKVSGLKATIGLSNILPATLMNMFELAGGLKTLNSTYAPKSAFMSYDDDTGFAGTPNDHAADCEYLDSVNHPCLTVIYPGSGHELDFHTEPAMHDTVPFFAEHVAGY